MCVVSQSNEDKTCMKVDESRLDIQALKYRSVTDIVRPIHQIVRRTEETTGHSVDLSETEVYCLSDPSRYWCTTELLLCLTLSPRT
jgi:hypothetical protein